MLVDKTHIGESLRRARRAKSLSQFSLAQRLGVQQGTISRAESGHNLRVDTLLEIAHALDLDLVLLPRRLKPVVESLLNDSNVARTPIYNGRGDEAYYEGEMPGEPTNPERGSLDP